MLSRLGLCVTMIAAVACAASQSKPKTPWRVEVTTSGGIAGRGIGSYAIDSDGNITIKTMGGKECTFRATAEELDHFTSILGRSKPDQWGRYVPENSCCDRITYTLTYDRYKAEWIDDPLPMPEDLVALNKALNDLRAKHACN
ncbi:MAG TPA: hypothetical protein VJZ00_15905 [Thermoanaerobaculia bacterium]|nr:hypothetical protein [Thermoanaerobaculia bacterium]